MDNNLTMEVIQAAIDKVRVMPKPVLREVVITRLVQDALKVTVEPGEEYILVHPATWARWRSDLFYRDYHIPVIGSWGGIPVIESDERAKEIMKAWIEKYHKTRILPRHPVVADAKS